MVLPRVPGEPPRDLGKPLEVVRLRIYPEIGGLRLDQALHRLLQWRSRSFLQRLIREGRVSVEAAPGDDPSRNVDPARAAMRVRAEEILVVQVPKDGPAPCVDWQDDEIHVVFEDEWLVAIDKPAGLTVHPSGRRLDGTLVNILHRKYRNPDDPERDVVPRLCHRLDRETSGLILVAKTDRAHTEVRRQFEATRVRKSYLAIVEGRVAMSEGRVDAAIGPDSRSAIRLKCAIREDGLASVTRWKLLRHVGRFSLLECFPETGRQHQIRVHLASIGHPLVGDKLYGPDENYFLEAMHGTLDGEARARLRIDRHALHSHSLRLMHPIDGTALEIRAPLAADLTAFLEDCVAFQDEAPENTNPVR
ncbi:MAG: RluA family pseudouridine synthase [Planctomycetes bacterium]|nr:RluA family pseudouridine synthase [Planctomycetota bacterium]MCB9919373.1 RluA family pseudouridine synthase [Planctomycetota bacterium]